MKSNSNLSQSLQEEYNYTMVVTCVTFQVISRCTLHLKINANTSCITESKEKKGTLSQIPVLIHIICEDAPSECAEDSSTTEG